MGFKSLIQNLFTEPVDEEPVKPITREKTTRYEPELPKKEEPIVSRSSLNSEVKSSVSEISDTPILSREERPKMPVYFDEDAFEDLKKPEEKIEEKEELPRRIERKPERPSKAELYKGNNKDEDVKVFKPSPIISPVYGVLEKNYRKDDIAQKQRKKTDIKRIEKTSSITVDDIRNKAFGTLEDELETSMYENVKPSRIEEELPTIDEKDYLLSIDELNSDSVETKEEVNYENSFDEDDLAKELERQKQKIEEINEFIKNNTVKKDEDETGTSDIEEKIDTQENLEELIEKDSVESEDSTYTNDEGKNIEIEEIEEDEDNSNDLDESDDGVESELFDLIDSMYEKKEEE